MEETSQVSPHSAGTSVTETLLVVSCLPMRSRYLPCPLRTTYIGQDGVTRTWEHAERTTRPEGSAFDGVSVVAILEKDTGKFLPLITSGMVDH